jgi:hypothetical protein
MVLPLVRRLGFAMTGADRADMPARRPRPETKVLTETKIPSWNLVSPEDGYLRSVQKSGFR